MKGALTLLLIAITCSFYLGAVTAKVVQRWDKFADEHLILEPKNADESSNTDVGFSQKLSKDLASRNPRTFWIPLGNFFNKPWKRVTTTTTTTTIAPTNPADSFDQTMLSLHNTLRKIHHVPDLVFSASLKTQAELCVAYHVQFGTSTLAGMTDPRQFSCASASNAGDPAESIMRVPIPAGGSSGTIEEIISKAITSAYGQQGPDYANPGYNNMNQQKVQIIWKSTREVGCATSFPKFHIDANNDKYVYISCIYNPPGNQGLAQDFQDNVLQP